MVLRPAMLARKLFEAVPMPVGLPATRPADTTVVLFVGWGGGYRTVQTMLSGLHPDEPPPDISTIQRLLKHAQPNAYPGDTGTHFSHMSHTPFPHISGFNSFFWQP